MTSLINETKLKRAIKIDAIGLDIPAGAAELFAEKAIKGAASTLKNKKLITEQDLNRALAKELKKYNPDLAYVYKNRDTII